MKKLKLSVVALICLFLNYNYAQQPSDLFYATMETRDAIELKQEHPEDIIIIGSNEGYSAVMLSDDAAHELHHKVLVHGPGFIYESSEKSAISAIERPRLVQKMASSFSITQETLVRQSLDLVDNINIANQIQELVGYGTRYHTTSNARQAVLDLKTKWEIMAGNRSDVSVRIVNHSSTNMPSVVMTITGTEKPDEFVILGGHIDSTARNGNSNNAPGADDNASGIATITEAARVLFEMDFKPKRTMEFMAFAAEEVGLRGSKEIAEDYKNRNVDVVSYMQLDMTNYKGSSNDIYVSTDSYNDDNLNDFLITLMEYYNASGTHKLTYGTSQCNYGCSDHYSWAQQGYNVAFPFEASFSQSNPFIHTTNDTFDRSPTPDATHAAKFAKLALEYLIEIGNGVGNSNENDCTITTDSFPYNQSFENSIGDWIQSTEDDINWTVDANGTPSNGTGPSNAVAGSYYLYVEASGNGSGFPTKKASLISPCFDLSGMSAGTLDFSYHMRGSAIGSLSVDIRTESGNSWTTIFNKSGSQGNEWNAASINISSYLTASAQIRFNAVTGSGYQSDIAIDAVKISESGTSTDICDGIDPFDSRVRYEEGDKVTYQGNLYERTSSRWRNLGPCSSNIKNPSNDLSTDLVDVFSFSDNPVDSSVDVILTNPLSENTIILLLDTKGSILNEISVEDQTTRINTTDLSSGLYFVTLVNGFQSYSKKLIKK